MTRDAEHPRDARRGTRDAGPAPERELVSPGPLPVHPPAFGGYPPASRVPLLSVRNLTKYFPIKTGLFGRRAGTVRAVDGISFDVAPG